jgi:Na+/H+ antiporter NhaD/arsenite permease-like protein
MDQAVLKLITLAIFLICYSLVISRRIKIAYVSIGSAIILLLIGVLNFQQVFVAINWDVLGIYWGFMMVAIIFAQSGIPAYLAKHILLKTKNEGGALFLLCALTAILSSFLENVGVVLIMAPIAIEIAKRAKSSLFIYLISIAISANMVTTVTMIADPPSLILASETGMNFLDFFWFKGKVGLGVISILSVIGGLATLYFLNFKKMKKEIEIKEEKIKINYGPLLLLIGGIIFLALNQFMGLRLWTIGLAMGIISLFLGRKILRKMIIEFDWNSFFFIFGIFIVIAAVEKVGILSSFANAIIKSGISNPILTLAVVTWLSVALSSFIDNVPFTVLMIPVCSHLANSIGLESAFPLLYGMLIGTGIGGNITPVGATANVFACGILEKQGYKIKLREYAKISIPTTIVSVLIAHLLLQFFWL